VWTILDSATRAAWFAATSEQGQLEALTAAFGGSPVTARLFAPDGVTLRRVLTLPALTIDTAADPRRIVLGAHLADSAVSAGTLGRWVLRSAGGVDIIQAPAGVSGATINHAGGGVLTLCTPTLGGVTITADSVLPAEPPPPYTLPSAGQARIIAASGVHTGVNPGLFSNANFTYSVFGSFGSGDFNPHWSARGAYMLAGTGGHNHPETFGCVYFDFQTGAWGYIGAVGQVDRGSVDEATETNGAPWYEMTGSEIPAPPHPYAQQVVLPPSLGGGSRGSMMYVTRDAVGIGARGAPVAHKFSLPGGVWSRAAATVANSAGFPVFDPVAGRWYMVPLSPWSSSSLGYLRGSDMTWQTQTGAFGYLTGDSNAGLNAFLYGRLLIVHQGNSAGTAGRFQALNLDSPAGWSVLNVTGNTTDTNYANTWAFHEAQGVFYRRYADSSNLSTASPQGQVIYKLTPPATNPLTNAWTITSVTLTGDTVPEFRAAPDVRTQAYRSLMYLPSIQMLAWVTANGVALLNPT
jgi:hypothetical protein